MIIDRMKNENEHDEESEIYRINKIHKRISSLNRKKYVKGSPRSLMI